MSSTTPPQAGVEPTVDVDSRFLSGTPVGVDVGRRNLLVLAPAPATADVAEGRVVHDARIEHCYTLLGRRPDGVTSWFGAILADHIQRLLDDVVQEAIAYVQSFDMPILVLEDLGYPQRSLEDCITDDAEPECWLYPTVHERLIEAAHAAGIPVMETSKKYTTRQCHVCGQLARVDDRTISCTTTDCPVDEVCRDRSAAATVANRVL